MQPESSTSLPSAAIPHAAAINPVQGTLVLNGVMRLTVNHGALTVQAGAFGNGETRSFPKTAGIERIVMLGFDGFITLEALRWINGIGAELLHVTPTGEIILHQAGKFNRNHTDLSRKQASGLRADEVIRYVLSRKLEGEAANLHKIVDVEEAGKIREIACSLVNITGVASLRYAEAQAASIYWNAVKDTPIRFPKSELPRIPPHWSTLGTRSSVLTGSPRRAINPANAMLNYAFAIGETASVTALMAVGLNPQLGWLHADQSARNSAALDLLECIRPDIEQWLIDWWNVRTFGWVEFLEGADGNVRLMPSVTNEIAATWPIWSKMIAPHAEAIARILAGENVKLPSPLTERNRSAGRGNVYLKPALPAARAGIGLCRVCGCEIPPGRASCDACLNEYLMTAHQEIAEAKSVKLKQAWAGERRKDDRSHNAEANSKRSEKLAANRQAPGGLKPPSPEWGGEFESLILPRLAKIGIRRIAAACSISLTYAGLIKNGKVPAVRHRAALHSLVAGVSLTIGL